MRNVLLAWEFGAGFGHILTLRRVAVRLMLRGFRCVAAVKDVGAASALTDAGVEVLQAPAWNVPQSSATLGDTLGDAGFADAQEIRPRIEAWRQIVSRVAPALVIADYAPGACLAARGRVPLALIGNGYTLPPGSMQTFPLLHQISPPVRPEQQLLDVTNSVLHDLRLQPLQRFPELFSGDVIGVHTLPLLDPYARWRGLPAQGLPLDTLPKARRDDASEILVYLSSWPGPQRPFVEALRPFASHVRLFAPGFSAAERERFAAWGMRLEAVPFDLTEDLASARLVIHLGSEGISGSCVMAGTPQLACAIDVEKELIGKALTEAGIGKFIPIYTPSVMLTEEMVAALLEDQATAERARQAGEAHRARYRDAEPFDDFIRDCLKLLG